MASGDTDVSICSDACLLLGAGTISSFTDGYDKSTVCSRLYPDIRDTVLGMREWSFSVVKSVLARNVTAPINEWSYKYDLPGDLNVGPIAAYNSSSSGATPPSPVGSGSVITFIRTKKRSTSIIRRSSLKA
jgi:hypothetical protein